MAAVNRNAKPHPLYALGVDRSLRLHIVLRHDRTNQLPRKRPTGILEAGGKAEHVLVMSEA